MFATKRKSGPVRFAMAMERATDCTLLLRAIQYGECSYTYADAFSGRAHHANTELISYRAKVLVLLRRGCLIIPLLRDGGVVLEIALLELFWHFAGVFGVAEASLRVEGGRE